MRRQFDHRGGLMLRESSIMPRTMLTVDFQVVEDWLWQRGPKGQLTQGLRILFEQHKDNRDHLARNTSHHLGATRILACSLIVAAFERNQALIEFGPFRVFELNRMPHRQIHRVLHLPLPAWRQFDVIERVAGLGDAGCPPEVRLELRGTIKVGNIADAGNDRGGLRWADARDRGQNLSFAGMRHNLGDLGFQLFKMPLNEFEFGDELLLLKGQTAQAGGVLRPNALRRELLEFQEPGIGERAILPSHSLQCRQAGRRDGSRSREAFADGKSGGKVRVFQDLCKLRKDLVADRGQLVSALGAFDGQLVPVLNHPSQLRGGFGWRSQAADRLHGITHLNALLQLIEQEIAQAQRIPFVGFEQALLPLLHMHDIRGDLHLLQVLQQRAMIMPGHFHDHVDLGQWDIAADAINQRAKPFARVVKGQGRAALKALVPTEQRGGDEACHMGLFADVHSDVQRLVAQHRNNLEISVCFTDHDRASWSVSFLLVSSAILSQMELARMLVPPVRGPQSSTAVKAKTSAPSHALSPTCAALTRRALWTRSPHREGTRSRRCGRRLTGERGERLTSGRKRNGGTDWATPAGWAAMPPLACLSSVRCSWVPSCASAGHERLFQQKSWWVEKRGSVGVPLPTLDKESGFQTLIRCTSTLPSLPLRVELHERSKVLRCLFQQIASLPGFSKHHCISILVSNQVSV